MELIEQLIKSGYGYTQMLQEAQITEQDLATIVADYPAFALVIKARYGVVIEPTSKPATNKPLKNNKKQEKQPQKVSEEVVDAKETISEGA